MYGLYLGIPVSIIVTLFLLSTAGHYFEPWFLHWAVSGCLGYCVWYVFRGIDVRNDQKFDNPPAFESPQRVPLAFGTINEMLRECHYGPVFWNVRTLDSDETRMFASLVFKETIGGVFGGRPEQLERMIVAEIIVDPVEDRRKRQRTKSAPPVKDSHQMVG